MRNQCRLLNNDAELLDRFCVIMLIGLLCTIFKQLDPAHGWPAPSWSSSWMSRLYSERPGTPGMLTAGQDGNLLPEPVNGIMTCYFWTGHLQLYFSSLECKPKIVLTSKKFQQPNKMRQLSVTAKGRIENIHHCFIVYYELYHLPSLLFSERRCC